MVWDNNDADTETADGKETSHATVGHTYQIVPEDEEEQISPNPANVMQFRVERNRQKFHGKLREIPPFRKSLNSAQFTSAAATIQPIVQGESSKAMMSPESIAEEPRDNTTRTVPSLKPLDLYWFCKLREGNTPLHAGFISKYVKDSLPLQRICYMDPISSSPTRNDVVRETVV